MKVMSARLAAGVERRLQSHEESELTLIIGVDDSESTDVIQAVEDTGAEIEEKLPLDYLAVSILEKDLNDLCQLDIVSSVDLEGEGSTLNDSDF